jgi:hypothetical protein
VCVCVCVCVCVIVCVRVRTLNVVMRICGAHSAEHEPYANTLLHPASHPCCSAVMAHNTQQQQKLIVCTTVSQSACHRLRLSAFLPSAQCQPICKGPVQCSATHLGGRVVECNRDVVAVGGLDSHCTRVRLLRVRGRKLWQCECVSRCVCVSGCVCVCACVSCVRVQSLAR